MQLEPVRGIPEHDPPERPPETEAPNGANGKRLLTGTMDQMLVFNDPATQCQRSIKINGYLYSDDTVEEVNKRADIGREVLERQFLIQDLKRMEIARENHIKSMRLQNDYLKELSTRNAARQGGEKVKHLTAQELKTLENGEAKVSQAQKDLEELEEKIAATKKTCGLG